MFLESVKNRISASQPLTVEEFCAVKELVEKCCKTHTIKKQNKKVTVEVGKPSDDGCCYNPTTGYKYGYETGAELNSLAEKNGWCGQFAGEKQWQKAGRKIIAGQSAYEYGSLYGREIKLFAYEQTEEI